MQPLLNQIQMIRNDRKLSYLQNDLLFRNQKQGGIAAKLAKFNSQGTIGQPIDTKPPPKPKKPEPEPKKETLKQGGLAAKSAMFNNQPPMGQPGSPLKVAPKPEPKKEEPAKPEPKKEDPPKTEPKKAEPTKSGGLAAKLAMFNNQGAADHTHTHPKKKRTKERKNYKANSEVLLID